MANKLADLISQHLWQIAAALGFAWSGYLISQTTINARLEALETWHLQIMSHESRICRLEALNSAGECKR